MKIANNLKTFIMYFLLCLKPVKNLMNGNGRSKNEPRNFRITLDKNSGQKSPPETLEWNRFGTIPTSQGPTKESKSAHRVKGGKSQSGVSLRLHTSGFSNRDTCNAAVVQQKII